MHLLERPPQENTAVNLVFLSPSQINAKIKFKIKVNHKLMSLFTIHDAHHFKSEED